jgi:hypothetical protein
MFQKLLLLLAPLLLLGLIVACPTETAVPTSDTATAEPTDTAPTENPGTATETAAPPTGTATAGEGVLQPGSPAIIDSPGDCVNLRSEPDADAENVITCLGHGIAVEILEVGPSTPEFVWYRISAPDGEGYVSGEFLSLAGE